MQMTDIIARMGGLQSIARELGVSESEVASGAQVLAPAILGGFKREAQAHPEGIDGLGGQLGQLAGNGLLENVLGPQPTDVSRGNGILQRIFGSKEVSRTVARQGAARSGLDPALLRRMLPMLAMLVTGYLSRHHQAARGIAQPTPAGGLGGILDGILGGQGGASPNALGGLGSILDMNGDGNPLDDILRMAGGGVR